MRLFIAGLMTLTLVACGGSSPPAGGDVSDLPPAMPEDAVSEIFERSPSSRDGAEVALPDDSGSSESTAYWGVRDGEALPIIWDDLMPMGSEEALQQEYADFYKALEARYADRTLEDGLEAIEEGSELDYMPQLGGFDTVEELDGKLVRIPGYVVPFDFNLKNRQASFLLAPYMGACIHTPPPPPNQIIFVEADPAVVIDDMWVAYWLEGTLRAETQESELAAAAYTLELSKIEPYGAP